MNRKWLLGILLVLFCITATSNEYAAVEKKTQSQSYEGLQMKLDVVKGNLINIQKTQNANNRRIIGLQKEIAFLDDNTNQLVKRIRSLEQSSIVRARRIGAINGEIAVKEKRMNSRIRAMQRMNPISAFDFLTGADNLLEAYKRIDMLVYICKSDQKMLKDMKQKRALVEAEKDQYDQKKDELVQLTKRLQATDHVSTNKLLALYIEQKNLGDDLDALEEQENMLLEASRQIESVLKGYIGDQTFSGNRLAWPVPQQSTVLSLFGMRVHPVLKRLKMHTGIDIQAGFGTPVVAAESGRVIIADWYGSYGRTVMIAHGNGIVTLYAHNDHLRVSKGDLVKRGDIISEAGSTGMSTGPHVHFEVRKDGKPVDPRLWL